MIALTISSKPIPIKLLILFWTLIFACKLDVDCKQTRPIEEIRIGIIIKQNNYNSKGGLDEPLNETIADINANTLVLNSVKLVPIVERIDSDNSYQASRAVCKLLAQRVWAVIGPKSIHLTPIIRSITSYHKVPLILINWQPRSYYLMNSTEGSNRPSAGSYVGGESSVESPEVPALLNYTINMYPKADLLSDAYLDAIRYKAWKSFTLIYDSPEDFMQVKSIFETTFAEPGASIHTIKLQPSTEMDMDSSADSDTLLSSSEVSSSHSVGATSGLRKPSHCDSSNYGSNSNLQYKKIMKDLKKRRVDNVLMSMPLDKACRLLYEASKVNMLSIYQDFVIANLDVHTLNLTQLNPVAGNISGYSLLEPQGSQVADSQSHHEPPLRWFHKQLRPKVLRRKLLTTEHAMINDAVSHLAYSLDEILKNAQWADQVSAPALSSCVTSATSGSEAAAGSEPGWQWGDALMDSLRRQARSGGDSGDIEFDEFGQRVDFSLDYILYRNSTFIKVADWKPGKQLEDQFKQKDEFGLQAIRNRTFKVTIAKTSPYIQLKQNSQDFIGNDRYEGYCIDLFNKLAAKLGFKYVLQEVADGKYGSLRNGTWNGMVRELLEREADMAIVDLTITKERQSAVEFTHPFMTLGIAIMYKKPKLEEAEMYSFLSPLSTEVWLSMLSAYLGMSLTLWLVSRLSPVEWKNPHPCVDNPNELEFENEIHSIGASMWFNIGSLMQQGSDLAPRSPSVRTLASVWFFFTLILISSYTANFAAFLTASRMQSPIESAEDLSKQTKIYYGCKDDSATYDFFRLSNHSIYRRMWNFMESKKHQGVFPKENPQGINMVKKGNYAFLMESTSLEYMAQRDCELTQIGGLLDHKGYGIALRKQSPLWAPLSKSIVELNEAGELQDLKNRWWIPANGTTCPEEKSAASATSELGIDKVGGVFVVLSVGACLGCITALLEFVWKKLKTPQTDRDPIGLMLWHEIKRIIMMGPSKRPLSEGSVTYDRSAATTASNPQLHLQHPASNGHSLGYV